MTKAAYIGVDNKARNLSKFYLGIPTFVPVVLPVEFTQIEYIESTGNQAINTGITPDLNTRVAMSFEMKAAPSKNVAIFAAAGQFSLRWTGSVFRHVTGSNTQDFSNNIGAVGRHHADKNGVTCTVDSETKTANVSSINITTPIYFCAINNNGLTAFSSVMIYRAQIYQNEMLVRDFIPCKNASDVAGLMDIVNNVFYASEGTGQFIAGSDTPQSLARAITKAYIGVNGVAQLFYEVNSFVLPTYTGQYVISGDTTKGSIQLLTSGTLTLHPATYDIFCVGGGASGRHNNYTSGYGGGSGYTYTKLNHIIDAVTECPVVIGSGGAETGGLNGGSGQKSGGQSSIVIGNNTYVADGGDNNNGGSGGGSSGSSVVGRRNGGDGGSNGSDGGKGYSDAADAGSGQGTTTRAFGESDNTLYAGGGGGGPYIPKDSTAGSTGVGGAGGGGGYGGTEGTANTGGGGGGARGGIGLGSAVASSGHGGSGIVIVRWGY